MKFDLWSEVNITLNYLIDLNIQLKFKLNCG